MRVEKAKGWLSPSQQDEELMSGARQSTGNSQRNERISLYKVSSFWQDILERLKTFYCEKAQISEDGKGTDRSLELGPRDVPRPLSVFGLVH